MFALIYNLELVKFVSDWVQNTTPAEPIYEEIINSAKIVDVAEKPFDVASPLFWVECPEGITIDTHWYNTENNTFNIMPEPAVLKPKINSVSTPSSGSIPGSIL